MTGGPHGDGAQSQWRGSRQPAGWNQPYRFVCDFETIRKRYENKRGCGPGVKEHPNENLARKIFHGRSGQLYQRYQDGMEDQIGALGLVLNALVLFTTRYTDAAVNQLRADGFDVRDEDIARLSPFVRHHINMLGRYSFQLPDLPGGLRPLRDPDSADG